MVNFNDIEDFRIFSVDFRTKQGNEATLSLVSVDTEEEIHIKMDGIDSYFCDKLEFNDHIEFKNKKLYIDNVECVITGVDYETISEFNLACEQLEQEEMNFFLL